MDKNKVEFGISKLHVGTYDVNQEGQVTLGEPYHQRGSVSLTLDPEEETTEFVADNIVYFSEISDSGFSGSIQVAKFSDDFKTKFMGYKKLADGGIAKVKGAVKPNVYIAFQAEGDKQSRKVILYNVSLGGITKEHTTIKKAKEPNAESVKISAVGDIATGIVQTTYNPDDAGYATVFKNPTAPTLEGAQNG